MKFSLLPVVPVDPGAMASMFPNFDPSVPPPGFGGMPRVPFQPGTYKSPDRHNRLWHLIPKTFEVFVVSKKCDLGF